MVAFRTSGLVRGKLVGARGIGELLGEEGDAAALIGRERIQPGHHVLHRIGGEQVGLLEKIENLVALPFRGAEAAIARRRFDQGLGLAAQNAQGRGLPQKRHIAPPGFLGLQHRFAVFAHGAGEGYESAGDVQRIERALERLFRHAPHRIGGQFLGADSGAYQIAGKGVGAGRRRGLLRFHRPRGWSFGGF